MAMVFRTKFLRYGLISGGMFVSDGSNVAAVVSGLFGEAPPAAPKQIQAGKIVCGDGRDGQKIGAVRRK